MTADQIKVRIAELRKNEEAEINQRVEKAINSGALDLSAYEDNYLLPKIILNAVYSDMNDKFYMNVSEHQAEVDNLKKFL